MSNGVYMDGKLTVGSTQPENIDTVIASVFGPYDTRTTTDRIAILERDIAQLRQLVADQGMMIAQLRELVTGEPPFLAPEGDWHMGE